MEENILGFIYYLQNPITKEIFYIGCTRASLPNRLRTHYQHLREFKRGLRKSNRRYEYLKSIEPHKATIHLLEIVTGTLRDLEKKEIEYISFFRSQNPNLTNMTDGGIGKNTSKYYTEEEMEEFSKKLSKSLKFKKKPEGFSENLSNIRKGLGNPAAKELKDWIIAEKEGAYHLFKYGFQVNDFMSNKNAYGNVYKFLDSSKRPYGYSWKTFSKLSKEIQDIVQTNGESF